jgi:hypothetical protein
MWVLLGTPIVGSYWSYWSTDRLTCTTLTDESPFRWCQELGCLGTVYRAGSFEWQDIGAAVAFLEKKFSNVVYAAKPGFNCALVIPFFYQWLSTKVSPLLMHVS